MLQCVAVFVAVCVAVCVAECVLHCVAVCVALCVAVCVAVCAAVCVAVCVAVCIAVCPYTLCTDPGGFTEIQRKLSLCIAVGVHTNFFFDGNCRARTRIMRLHAGGAGSELS